MLQPSDHLHGPPLDLLQQVRVFPVLRTPEPDAVFQVGSQRVKGALDPTVCIIEKDIKGYQSQYGPLRDTTHHRCQFVHVVVQKCLF